MATTRKIETVSERKNERGREGLTVIRRILRGHHQIACAATTAKSASLHSKHLAKGR
ncbi:Protein ImpG/VasA [Sesbania bispinosa]|nr:Protein ImpG/VasA [Sesbania bispinosa]